MKNIVLHGGSSHFRGFKERLDKDIRTNCDSFIDPHVTHIQDQDAVYKALYEITAADWLENISISRQLYNELGYSATSNLIL